MSKNDLVVKTNKLNEALQVLSLVELRIIQLAIVDARESGAGLSTDKPLRIDAMRYAQAFNTTRQNAYARMKEAEATLFERRFSFYDDEKKLVKSRWLQQVRYFDDEGAIEIVFTLAVVQNISRINGVENFFTQYLLSQTATLNSVYSARLYELLIQWKHLRKTPAFELLELRNKLGILENEYQRIEAFKRRVLDLAIREINEKTDISNLKYEQCKKGRKIVGFSFSYSIKKQEKNNIVDGECVEIKNDNNTIFYVLTKKQATLFSSRLAKNNYNIQQLAVAGESAQKLQQKVQDILLNPQNSTKKLATIVFSELKNAGFDPAKSHAKPLKNIEFLQKTTQTQVPQQKEKTEKTEKNDEEKRELAKMHISALLSRKI